MSDPPIPLFSTCSKKRATARRRFGRSLRQSITPTESCMWNLGIAPSGTWMDVCCQSSRQRTATGYVRVIVSPEKSRLNHDQLLALIGHELRHALEVLEHPEVVDDPTMENMYRSIGTPIAGQRGFETSAARSSGTAVLTELLRNTRAPQYLEAAARPFGD